MHVCNECHGGVEATAAVCPECGSEQPLGGWTDDPLIGRSVGGLYRIERRIGVGGMGVVYRALDRSGEAVAIKTLHPHLGQSDDLVRRFRREARIAGMLSGPHTVRVFGSGELPDGTLYYAMQYVAGQSLTALLEDHGRLDAALAADLLGQLADGLHEAHEVGLVHRDLKPDNLLISVDERGWQHLRILDFGIVKVLDARLGTVGGTRTDRVFGTPEYMAPEQAQGSRDIDRRVDVYAAGTIAFAMLANRLPFAAETAHGTMVARLRRAAPGLSEVLGDGVVPGELEALVARMLERDPEARPATMAEVRRTLDLMDLGTPLPTPHRPAPGGILEAETLPVALAPTEAPGATVTNEPAVRSGAGKLALTVLAFVGVMLAAAFLFGRA